jgi:mono/diheme cytochrome c family protein
LSLFFLGGCDLPGKPDPRDQYRAPQEEMRFDVLYKQNCAGCHGAWPDGRYGPAPPLNDPLFLAIVPHTAFRQAITAGRELPPASSLSSERPDKLMPAFATSHGGALTTEQIKVLMDGIRRQWSTMASAPKGAPHYLDTEAKPQAARSGDPGMKVFKLACANCHGDDGQGGRIKGKPVGAIHDPDFLALFTDQALRRLVITGRPDLGMPDYAHDTGRSDGFKPLTDQDVADVVALLTSWRQGSATHRRGD